MIKLYFDRIDRYVLRYFWTSVAVVFLFFFGFFLIIDLFANADEFVDTAKKFHIPARTMATWVVGFYVWYSPSIFLQVAPFVTVIGGIVAVARMNRENELIPVLMSGRSIFRMLRPVFVCAGLLTGLMIVVQEWVAPAASDKRIALGHYLREGDTDLEIDRQLTDEEGNFWVHVRIDPVSGSTSASIRAFDAVEKGTTRHVDLAGATYDAVRRGWTVEGGIKVVTDDARGHRDEIVTLFPSSLTPRQIIAQNKQPFDLSFAELGFLYRYTKQPRFQVLLHYHVTFPLTNLLLLLLAIPFVLHYDRQKVMQGFAIAFLLCVAYFGVDSGLRQLGEHALHPILAAWFAPLLFGALGITLFDGVRT